MKGTSGFFCANLLKGHWWVFERSFSEYLQVCPVSLAGAKNVCLLAMVA